MPEYTFTSQILLLRKLVCLLLSQSGDELSEKMHQPLEWLINMLCVEAAAVYWREDEELALLAQCPETYSIDAQISRTMTNPARLDEVMEGRNGEAAWLVAPMRSEGVTRGRLGVVVRPGRVWSREERELLRFVANQLAIAGQNAIYQDQVAALSRRRGKLLRRLIEADEQCSRRVSRELHDEIGQSLAALVVEVDTILSANLGDAALIESHLDHLRRRLVQVTDEVDRIVLDLRPTLLENSGLMAALGWYGIERLRPMETRLHIAGGQCAPQLSSCLTTMLYRIGQEALSNVARHAQAANASLSIDCKDNHLTLTINDDGCGFDTARVLDQPQGLQGIGLLGMQERATLIDGDLTINSKAGQGTRIHVRVPLNDQVTNEKDQSSTGRRSCGSA